MGAAGSVVHLDELTAEQKAQVCRAMQIKYDSMRNGGAEEKEVFKKLVDTYDAGLSACAATTTTTATAPSTQSSDVLGALADVIHVEDDLGDGVSFRPYEDGQEDDHDDARMTTTATTTTSLNNSSSSSHIDDDFDHSNPMLRIKTSQDLLSEMDQSHENQHTEQLTTFIEKLSSGVSDKEMRTSQFRKRRLTYAHRDNKPVEPTVPERRERAKRTTIYASTEIGVRQEKVPPFPDNYLGTFSCHGIEPGDNDEIHDKINQDRGCVVYPYNSSMTEALFIVLDGHGEQGDKVSEFVMRQVVISLEKHAQLLIDPSLALVETFIKTNKALQATEINFMTSGCTCVAAYITGRTLFVANCGDSRAVMARGSASLDDLVAADLSRDHKPDDPAESERITAMGGFVQPAPEPGLTARVYLDAAHTMIGLAMSRSIGNRASQTTFALLLYFGVCCCCIFASDPLSPSPLLFSYLFSPSPLLFSPPRRLRRQGRGRRGRARGAAVRGRRPGPVHDPRLGRRVGVHLLARGGGHCVERAAQGRHRHGGLSGAHRAVGAAVGGGGGGLQGRHHCHRHSIASAAPGQGGGVCVVLWGGQ